MGISAIDDDFALIQGRLNNGFDILIRKLLRGYINFVLYDDCRFVIVELLQNGDAYIFFINTYMPFECDDNYKTYVQHFLFLHNSIDEANTHHIAIIG